MNLENLLSFKKDVHSQNGEDGVIATIFEWIGTTTKKCCEFGAWDGIHLSNCRSLILSGWSAIMIEGEKNRYLELLSNYEKNELVSCVNSYVDTDINKLSTILNANNFEMLDFLSVDIDGLDYEIFEALDVWPRVICIEVNAGHNPENGARINRDVARNNIGQSLQVFTGIADAKGYGLACYTGNAFFIRKDIIAKHSLTPLSCKQAYIQFLKHLSISAKEWLYLVNLGAVDPYYKYANSYLDSKNLGIATSRAIKIRFELMIQRCVKCIIFCLRKIALV